MSTPLGGWTLFEGTEGQTQLAEADAGVHQNRGPFGDKVLVDMTVPGARLRWHMGADLPRNVVATPTNGVKVRVAWDAPPEGDTKANVYHATTQTGTYTKLTGSPIAPIFYDDLTPAVGTHWYTVSFVDDEGTEGPQSSPVSAVYAAS